MIIAGEPLLGLFSFSEQGAAYAFRILIVYGATMWLTLYNAIHVTGTLRCGGDTKFAMITETGTVWLIGVPLAFITSLYLHMPCLLYTSKQRRGEACGAGGSLRTFRRIRSRS